jgi:hypothetical protein
VFLGHQLVNAIEDLLVAHWISLSSLWPATHVEAPSLNAGWGFHVVRWSEPP